MLMMLLLLGLIMLLWKYILAAIVIFVLFMVWARHCAMQLACGDYPVPPPKYPNIPDMREVYWL
jgi:hypothetical protein